jgi:formylglycine-generating enzyme required for sulfatase activity
MATRYFEHDDPPPAPREPSKRIALVVGNGDYVSSRLSNPPRDAELIGHALKSVGFDTEVVINADKQALETAIVRLGERIERAGKEGIGFFYFAGHGIQHQGVNYMVPVGTKIPDVRYLKSGAVAVEYLVEEFGGKPTNASVIVLDACRDNRISGTGGGLTRGLAAIQGLPNRTIVAFATAAGQVAEDGARNHSPYAASLAARLVEPNRGLVEIFDLVAEDVAAATHNTQHPALFMQGAVSRVVLRSDATPQGLLDATPALAGAALLSSRAPEFQAERKRRFDFKTLRIVGAFTLGILIAIPATLWWSDTQKLGQPAEARSPSQTQAKADLEPKPQAQTKSQPQPKPQPEEKAQPQSQPQPKSQSEQNVGTKSQPPPKPKPETKAQPKSSQFGVALTTDRRPGPLTLADLRTIKPKSSFKECDACPEMVVIPPGSFIMGAAAGEPGQDKDEGPRRRVTFAQQFGVGKFAVTFEEWDVCVADGGCNGYRPNDHSWGRGMRPVINVNWDDAQAYIAWLTRKTGKPYRLLSEAEREYVTRANTTTQFWFGSSLSTDHVNYDGSPYMGPKGEHRKQTLPVNSFKPNPFGLYQVHGNVWEWTQDCWYPNYRGAPTDGSAWLAGNCGRRVVRGGSWNSEAEFIRAAYRYYWEKGTRNAITGFRVARTLD